MINENKKEVKMQNHIDNLIESGIIKFGQKAKDNPKSLELASFALGVANKDYPAMTPHLWNNTYAQLGLYVRNIRLFGDPANINKVLQAFKEDPRYQGGDIGVGFKDKAWQIVDQIDPLAKEMQAINVIVKQPDGKLKGYNTDGLGYATSLETELEKKGKGLSGQKIVILGAGGTGNAIAFALADKGAMLTIINRTEAKAVTLAQRLNQFFGSKIAESRGRENIEGNLTGTAAIVSVIDDSAMPLDKYSALGDIHFPETAENIEANIHQTKKIMDSLSRDVIISDVMLRSEDTATIRLAKETGFSTLDGLPMVLNQAIEAFWLVNQTKLEKMNVTKQQIAQIMENIK